MGLASAIVAAEGGPRWHRAVGLLVVVAVVLILRSVLVRLIASSGTRRRARSAGRPDDVDRDSGSGDR